MTAPLRVVHIIPDLGTGGAEQMLVNLVLGADQRMVSPVVMCLFGPSDTPLEGELKQSGVEVQHLGKHLGFDARMFYRLARAIRASDPDVIHTHRSVMQYAMPAMLGRRVVHTVHNMADREVPWYGRVAHRAAFRSGVHPVAIGQQVAESIRRVYGVEPAAIIHNAIPVRRYGAPAAQREYWRSCAGISTGDVVFVCLARLTPQKNVSLAIEAFAHMKERHRAVLLIAGQGELRQELENWARALLVHDRVRFLGVRRDVPELLAASDVFVLPSLWEGNPLAVLEAMSAGLPVVGTSVGGVPEYVETARSGVLVPSGDVGAFRGAMDRMCAEPETRRLMGSRGRERALSLFDVAVMTRGYQELYERVVNSRQGVGW